MKKLILLFSFILVLATVLTSCYVSDDSGSNGNTVDKNPLQLGTLHAMLKLAGYTEEIYDLELYFTMGESVAFLPSVNGDNNNGNGNGDQANDDNNGSGNDKKVTVEDAYVDEQGDLNVDLSNGNSVNAGELYDGCKEDNGNRYGQDKQNKEPHIGHNGNWWIDGKDTGCPAHGSKGEDGVGIVSINKQFTDGLVDTYVISLSNGKTFMFTVTNARSIVKTEIDNDGYLHIYYNDKTEELVGKVVGEDGKDGETPYIGENGNWWIGDNDTGVAASGKDGEDGEDGTDGETPYIGKNGNWWIGDNDTGVAASGKDGEDGVGIREMYVDGNGHLIVILTNGEAIDCGLTHVSPDGSDHIHEFGEWKTERPATCIIDGILSRVCTVCNKEELTKISATGVHTEVIDNAIAPSCTSNGFTEGKHCSVCNEVIVKQEEIGANGHIEVIDESVEATCSKAGLTEGKHCSVCNEVLVAQTETPVIAHTYTDKYDESCNECGFIRDAECAHINLNTIPAVAATCTETGLTEGKVCAKCEEIVVKQTVTDAKGHTEVINNAVAPTCTANGLTEGKHCSVCNTVLVAQNTVPALGHTLGNAVVENNVNPTCTKNGSYDIVVYCSVCNDPVHRIPMTIPAKGHTEVIDNAVAPTCTATGLTEGKSCAYCHEVLVAQTVVGVLDHTEKIIPAVDATCTSTGLTEGKQCSECEMILLAQETIAKIPHTESRWVYASKPSATENGLRYKYCTICNEIVEEVAIAYVEDTPLEYSINSDKISCTITGIGDFEGTELIIPDYIQQYKVTAIADKAFWASQSLTSIRIPETLKEIGSQAFGWCTSVTNIYIPASVTFIGSEAFCRCDSLVGIEVSKLNAYYQSIDGVLYTEYGTKLVRYPHGKSETSFAIPQGVTSIGNYAFSASFVLESVTIPEGVTIIDDCAFYICTALKSVNIPSTVERIGVSAFSSCSSFVSATYNGTVDQWKAISKGGYINKFIYCTDGEIKANGNVTYYN